LRPPWHVSIGVLSDHLFSQNINNQSLYFNGFSEWKYVIWANKISSPSHFICFSFLQHF
jgi:hypothetical protein